jgi:hypothetical protein
MTTVGKTTRGALLARSGVLALALAAFIPLAIPAAASASTDKTAVPLSGSETFTNDVKAVAFPYLKDAVSANATLDVGINTTISAVNRAEATTKCSGCTAVALALQMVTATTLQTGGKNLHVLDVGTATSEGCLSDCNAVADAWQFVVATTTPQPLPWGQLLTFSQLETLNSIRSSFTALQDTTFTPAQIQTKAKALVAQAQAILEAATYTPESATPATPFAAFTGFTLPTFSPAAPGVDMATGSSTTTSHPVVTLYKDLQFDPWLAG